MRSIIFILLCWVVSLDARAQYSLSSPDKTAWVVLKTDMSHKFNSKTLIPKRMRMSVSVKGHHLVRNREIGLTLFANGRRSSFGKSDMVNYSQTKKTISKKDETAFFTAGLEGRYNAMVLESVAGIILEIVMFDNGMAYRFSTSGFADDYEYKILEVTNVFPDDKPNAIFGTFTGDKVLPWHFMLFDQPEANKALADEWQSLYPSNKVISWKNALSSVSLGVSTNWISGKRWGGLNNTQSIYADFIYKYLYGGLSVSPCQELLYVFYDYDFDPFTRVIGSIKSWDISGKFGFNLPVQNGYDLWAFSP